MDITWVDKEALSPSGLPRINSWTDQDANEVKQAVNSKVDKVAGKGLSTNDFDDDYADTLDYLMQGIFLSDLVNPGGARIRYNTTTSEWEVSNNGTDFFAIGQSSFDPENITTFLRFSSDKWIGKRLIGTDGATSTVAIVFSDAAIYMVIGDNNNYSGIQVRPDGTINLRSVNGGNSGTVNELNLYPGEATFDKVVGYNPTLALPSLSLDGHLVHLKKLNDSLALKLDASAYNDRYKGKFATLSALQTAYPSPISGWYALVDADGTTGDVKEYIVDTIVGGTQWVVSSGTTITSTDSVAEGSTNLYFTNVRAVAALSSTLSNYLLITDISNSLTGTSTVKALSEAQGKALKDLIDVLTTTVGGKLAITSNLSDLNNITTARQNLGMYESFASLPSGASAIKSGFRLVENCNTYLCLATYTKGADFKTDFDAGKWQLVGEGKRVVTNNISGGVTIDLSTGNFFVLTLTANVTSFAVSNALLGHTYVFRFIRASGTTYTLNGWSSGQFESSTGIDPVLYTPPAWVTGTTYSTGNKVTDGGKTWKRSSVTAGFNSASAPASNTYWSEEPLYDVFVGTVVESGVMMLSWSMNNTKNTNLGW